MKTLKLITDTKLERLTDEKLISIRKKAKKIITDYDNFSMSIDYKALFVYIKTIANILYERSVTRALNPNMRPRIE